MLQNGVGLTDAVQSITVKDDSAAIYINGVLTPVTPYIGKKSAELYLGKIPLGG